MTDRAARVVDALVPELPRARAKMLALRQPKLSKPWANLSNAQKKHLFETMLIEAGFFPGERNGYEIARKLEVNPNTLRGVRARDDLTRALSDELFKRLEQCVAERNGSNGEITGTSAEFGRTG